MKAFNLKNDRELSHNVVVADSVLARMKGLLGRKRLEDGEALWIKPCRGIHTIGMSFPIDVLFLDADNVVVEARENIPPNRLSKIVFKAKTVLELPAGTLSATETRAGDTLRFST
ncbi:MAG: DUF192 domain-containing protein [Thermodesulfobacteriota bacterium]